LLALLTAAHKRFLFGQAGEVINLQLHQAAVEAANRLPDSLDKALTLLLVNIGPTNLEPDQITRQLDEAIRIFGSLNDEWSEAMAYLVLGDNAVYQVKDFDLAMRSYRRSQEVFKHLGHDWGCALCLSGLANAALVQGELLEAVHLWQESVDLYQKTHNLWRLVDVRNSISAVLARLGRSQEALVWLEQNVSALQGLGASTNLGWTLAEMAHLALDARLPGQERSQLYYRRAMDIFNSLGDEESIQRLQTQAAGWSQAA
jgi:tetratricopeptide (TPR) repeat protein